GALARSPQIAGGLDYLLRQASQYATERRQFGKPIGSFKVIQQNLAVLAGHAAAAGTAAANAFRAADRGDAAFEIAAAKVRVGEAAGVGASVAHQTHGAIGFTYEHALQFVTRRLWSWRAEFGGEALIQFLKPVVMDQNPLDRERLYQGLWQRSRATTYRAIGAMDIALWDIAGKVANMPIHRLLGSYRDSVPAYASSAVLASKE